MVRTKKQIEKALEFCDKQDRDLDEEQERPAQRRQRVDGVERRVGRCQGLYYLMWSYRGGHSTVGEVVG
jgi:hypothetical protein